MDSALGATDAAASRLAAFNSHRLRFSVNATALVAALILLFTAQRNSPSMRVGAVAGESVVAQHQVTYLDTAATTANRNRAMLSVTTQYMTDTQLAQQRNQQASVFLTRTGQYANSDRSQPRKTASILRLLPPGASASMAEHLASLTTADFRQVRTRSLSLLSQALGWKFDKDQVTATAIGLLSTIAPEISNQQRSSIGDVLATFLSPTSVPDVATTTALRQRAARRVPPVYNTIQAGEVIMRRGDLITPANVEQLTALGYSNHTTTWRDVVASLLFSVVILGMLFWYLRAFHRDIMMNGRLLILVDASILVAVAAARFLTPGHVLLPFFLPIAAATTFAAVLIAPEACVAIALAMAVLAGWIAANSYELTIYYFVSSAAGILAVRKVRHLKQFVFAGVFITIFALATISAFGLVAHADDAAALREYALAAACNGFLSATLALGGFALISDLFGVTTMLQLLELGQPSQPLLRRLMVRAPGTYNHSLIVSSMVERAAEDIGANAMMAKAGALYHDVGKTVNPHCFVENQMGMGNIHDELKPEESARIIRGHVFQGLRLGRQHKLPQVIINAIAEHHGTMAISYFLHKAQQETPDGAIDRSVFVYPGPRPRSKETALLMLADGCESAVRAAADHSHERIAEIVHRIFAERIEQGQLSESPLTLHDLERAQIAFCSVLNGLYHPRIDYPEAQELTANSTIAGRAGRSAHEPV